MLMKFKYQNCIEFAIKRMKRMKILNKNYKNKKGILGNFHKISQSMLTKIKN